MDRDYLRNNSGLPGPRANLALAQKTADEGSLKDFDELIKTDDEYLVLCGVIGLGKLLASKHNATLVKRLKRHAADERWRIREGVALALQRVGAQDWDRLYAIATDWASLTDPLVQRAAVAGVCEPPLLKSATRGAQALVVCQTVTAKMPQPRNEALRKALGYCWSVAIAADPGPGVKAFRELSRSGDPDVQWIVRENAKKSRLAKLL